MISLWSDLTSYRFDSQSSTLKSIYIAYRDHYRFKLLHNGGGGGGDLNSHFHSYTIGMSWCTKHTQIHMIYVILHISNKEVHAVTPSRGEYRDWK